MNRPIIEHAYLVIDQGGHGTRALVFNAQGRVLVSVQAPVIALNPDSGWFEQDVANLVSSIKECLQRLEDSLQQKNILISSAALITQRSSLLACYKDSLQAITPVISWQDTRNNVWLQKQFADGCFDLTALKQLTGLRLNAHYGASKIRWLLDNDSKVQEAERSHNLVFLPLAAFVTHLLTGSNNPLLDAATASRTFLTEFGKVEWSKTLLKLFSIPQDTLPALAASKDEFGNIAICQQRIPLKVVGGDQSFLPFAYGKQAWNNSFFINAGTGAFVQTVLSITDTPSQLLCSLAAIDQQQQLTVAEGTVNACASALDWLFQQEQKIPSHEEIEHALQTFLSPPVFYHRITALGSPYWLPIGESSFSAGASLAEKIVAVIESIVFLLAINIDLLLQAKPETRQILISGGISRSNGFCQKLADCTGLGIVRHEDHEASSRGAAFYLANISTYYPDQAPAFFYPRPDSEKVLLTRYQSFREWLQAEDVRHTPK